jgi:hypothetical protein
MSDDAGDERLRRTIFGRPSVWLSATWLALGVVWIALATTEPTVAWRWIVGGAWILIGTVQLLVAVSDRRHHRGRYAPRSRAS